MTPFDCPVLNQAYSVLGSNQFFREFLIKHLQLKTTNLNENEQSEAIIRFMFLGPDNPVWNFSLLLRRCMDQIIDYGQFLPFSEFSAFCVAKSLPLEIHSRFSDAFRGEERVIRSDTNDKEIIVIQLASAALAVMSWADFTCGSVPTEPGRFGAYTVDFSSQNWTDPFRDRARQHIVPWGEPPREGILFESDLERFLDAFIKNGILYNGELGSLDNKISVVEQFLAAKKKDRKYYVAILPEKDSPLMDALAKRKALRDLTVVACPEFTHASLAIVRIWIDEVRDYLARIRQRCVQ